MNAKAVRRAYMANRRSKNGTLSPEQAEAIMLNAVCAVCGTDQRLEMDHIVPLSQGGANDPSNIQVLCIRCHARKTQTETPRRPTKHRMTRKERIHAIWVDQLIEKEREPEG